MQERDESDARLYYETSDENMTEAIVIMSKVNGLAYSVENVIDFENGEAGRNVQGGGDSMEREGATEGSESKRQEQTTRRRHEGSLAAPSCLFTLRSCCCI